MDNDAILGRAVLARIDELIRWERHWYRQRADWYAFTELRRRNRAELRALVRLAREARKAAAAAEDAMEASYKAPDLAAGDHFRYPAVSA